ncbi:MAG TPA: type II secretion system F family protein [Streptosporangiaceae bacterium]|nr:type II secretion system F family protein [Streptosporangiaceae bacterium]
MNIFVIIAGALAGLGVYLAISQLLPAPAHLDAVLARIHGTGSVERDITSIRSVARHLNAQTWLPVPAPDLALLGQDREQWMVSKVSCGLIGLCLVPVLDVLLLLAGDRLPLEVPVVGSLAVGLALFLAPDLVVRVNAAEKRHDFRHALTSYLDLVSLERGAGAAPTQALESAAVIGGGWAFARIAGALSAARKAGRPPWEGLADLAEETGIQELVDLAEIAAVAGHEGASILQTLSAKAESMRTEALSATKAKAGSRSTTMVVPIVLLASGFLLLLVFPMVYRTFG